MNEQELNKKLAEWAGFKIEDSVINGVHDWIAYDKNKQGYRIITANFTQSLDACFKWLVPKLYRVSIGVNNAPDGNVFWNAFVGYEEPEQLVGVTNANPALALCLAIEKLINITELNN